MKISKFAEESGRSEGASGNRAVPNDTGNEKASSGGGQSLLAGMNTKVGKPAAASMFAGLKISGEGWNGTGLFSLAFHRAVLEFKTLPALKFHRYMTETLLVTTRIFGQSL
jgi:hypothetical protein